jgi:hypothetical protein
MKKIITSMACLILTLMEVQALDLDEKLTFRILRLSETKKTALINRGLEDGLVVGDHAKFYLTYGVVARAVVVQASPSRSVWSIYRLVNGNDIGVDKVLRLKIATPAKLTEDASKMVSAEDIAENQEMEVLKGDSEKVSLQEMPTTKDSDSDEREFLKDGYAYSNEETPMTSEKTSYSDFDVNESVTMSNKTLELFSMLHYSGLKGTTDTGDVAGNVSGKSSFTDFTLGFEKYFENNGNLITRLSLGVIVEKMSLKLTDFTGNGVEDSSFTYGAHFNYHFLHHPLVTNKIIPYANVGLGIGNTRVTQYSNNGSADESKEASSNYYSIGPGLKYFTSWGLGARGLIDFYRRGEDFPVDDEENYTRVVSGIRIRLGLSYRW